jgi:hypothetical protein
MSAQDSADGPIIQPIADAGRLAKPADSTVGCTVHPFCWAETDHDTTCEGCGMEYGEWSGQ